MRGEQYLLIKSRALMFIALDQAIQARFAASYCGGARAADGQQLCR